MSREKRTGFRRFDPNLYSLVFVPDSVRREFLFALRAVVGSVFRPAEHPADCTLIGICFLMPARRFIYLLHDTVYVNHYIVHGLWLIIGNPPPFAGGIVQAAAGFFFMCADKHDVFRNVVDDFSWFHLFLFSDTTVYTAIPPPRFHDAEESTLGVQLSQ